MGYLDCINGTILSLLLDYLGFPNSICRMISALDRSRMFALETYCRVLSKLCLFDPICPLVML